MKAMSGYYSILQYCPDPFREEAANVGVLLYCPALNYIDVKISAGNDRVRRFFKKTTIDGERLNSAKKAVKDRICITERTKFKNLASLEGFITSMANELRFTKLRSITVDNAEITLEKIFLDLVGGRIKRDKEKKNLLRKKIDEAFRKPIFKGRIKYDQQFIVPIANRQIKIPYTYENGSMNLVRPERFDTNAGIDKALRLASTGDLIQRYDGKGVKKRLIIVSVADDKDVNLGIEEQIVRIFDEYKIRTVRGIAIDDFLSEVEKEAHI